MENPFKPSFGVSPPLLAGRGDLIADHAEGLREGPGSPFRSLIIKGQRGSGKTVLLNTLEGQARDLGWHVVSTSARPGMAAELQTSDLPAALQGYPGAQTTRVTSAQGSVGPVGGGGSVEYVDHFPITASLRHLLTTLVSEVTAAGGEGLLITVDEVSADALDDLQVLTQALQHLFREELEVALVVAGLPHLISDLLDHPGTTFLRRSERADLGPIDDPEVEEALTVPMEMTGKVLSGQALQAAMNGTEGYPFMLQLVGYYTWRAARDEEVITLEKTHDGVERARRRIGELVHAPALRDLSPTDRSYLVHMAVDDGPSRTRDIADRLGVGTNYAAVYRQRLIQAEIITSAGHGYVDFTLPEMREYLRSHATHEIATP